MIKLGVLDGAVKIVFPMGLPPYDPIRMELGWIRIELGRIRIELGSIRIGLSRIMMELVRIRIEQGRNQDGAR